MSLPSSKRAVLVRAVLLIVLAAVSLAAWLVPGMLGAPSSFDSLVIAIWLIAMVLLLADSRRRDRKRKRYLRTFYIDSEASCVFGPMLGTRSYSNGSELLDLMTVALANEESAALAMPSDDFAPEYVVETEDFACVRDARLQGEEPVTRADDVTVVRWEGAIVDLSTGREKEFVSPFDLEDVFCPGCAEASSGESSWASSYVCATR